MVTTKKEEWQIREKHFRDLLMLVKELNFVDSRGSIRRFDGKIFYPKFKDHGHTSYQHLNSLNL